MNAPGVNFNRGYSFVTNKELEILKKHYPIGGTAACMPLLPNYTKRRIQKVALDYGIRCTKPAHVLAAMRRKNEKAALLQAAKFIKKNAWTEEEKALADTINYLATRKFI